MHKVAAIYLAVSIRLVNVPKSELRNTAVLSLSMAVFSKYNLSIWNILDNLVCGVMHVNGCLVVHIRKFKRTISNNESQCRGKALRETPTE